MPRKVYPLYGIAFKSVTNWTKLVIELHESNAKDHTKCLFYEKSSFTFISNIMCVLIIDKTNQHNQSEILSVPSLQYHTVLYQLSSDCLY